MHINQNLFISNVTIAMKYLNQKVGDLENGKKQQNIYTSSYSDLKDTCMTCARVLSWFVSSQIIIIT